jgi:hypothetical protein
MSSVIEHGTTWRIPEEVIFDAKDDYRTIHYLKSIRDDFFSLS